MSDTLLCVSACPLTVSVSNLVWIHSKMAELWQFNWFQNGGRRHLGFLHYVIFGGKSDCGTPFPTYASNSVQMCANWLFWPKMWFKIWRPPPSWILCDTSSGGKSCLGTLFLVSVSNLAQIRSKMAELWPFNWFQNGGRGHLGFLHYVNFGGKSDCGTPFPTYVSNSVQMRAKMAELWTKMWFSIWRPPPSWILLDTNSEDKGSPGTLFSVSVSFWCKPLQK